MFDLPENAAKDMKVHFTVRKCFWCDKEEYSYILSVLCRMHVASIMV